MLNRYYSPSMFINIIYTFVFFIIFQSKNEQDTTDTATKDLNNPNKDLQVLTSVDHHLIMQMMFSLTFLIILDSTKMTILSSQISAIEEKVNHNSNNPHLVKIITFLMDLVVWADKTLLVQIITLMMDLVILVVSEG